MGDEKKMNVLKLIGVSLISAMVLAIFFIQVYCQFGNSKVEAKIDGLGTKLVVLSYKELDSQESHFKFAFCINDEISINASVRNISEAKIVVIEKRRTFRSRRINFYIKPNEEILLKGVSNATTVDYEIINGNKLSEQYAELRKELLPFYEEESKLWLLSRQLRDTDRAKSISLTKQFDSLRFFTVASLRNEWAKNHLDYELAPKYFLESHVHKDTLMKYHRLLSEKVKNSHYGKVLSEIVQGWENSKIGNIAPDFTQTTFNGDTFHLAELRGKYVVLDFWGTWCAPCMKGMPKMKKYYQNYQSQLEFVGIACQDKESIWRKTVRDREMNWIQLLSDQSKVNYKALYGIKSYPTKIIIDTKGKIVNKFIGETRAFYNEIDSLMNI